MYNYEKKDLLNVFRRIQSDERFHIRLQRPADSNRKLALSSVKYSAGQNIERRNISKNKILLPVYFWLPVGWGKLLLNTDKEFMK